MSEDLDFEGDGGYRWTRTDVPRKGWTCIHVEDHDCYQKCEMCQNPHLRYVHHLRHSSDPKLALAVGSTCSGHLEKKGSTSYPKERESQLRNRSARRTNWAYRAWKTSANGNLYLRSQGEVYVIWKTRVSWGGGWKVKDASSFGSTVPAKHNTWKEAALALFDLRWPSRIQCDAIVYDIPTPKAPDQEADFQIFLERLFA